MGAQESSAAKSPTSSTTSVDSTTKPVVDQANVPADCPYKGEPGKRPDTGKYGCGSYMTNIAREKIAKAKRQEALAAAKAAKADAAPKQA